MSGVFWLIAFLSCRSTKKIQQAITKRDTASVAVIAGPTYADSVRYISNMIDSIHSRELSFTTFSARTKVVYANKDGKQPDFIAYIRMKKDSIIWLSLANDIGIEGIRMLISPDSVKVMDKLAKTIQIRPLSSLQELSQIPFSFFDLQRMIVGQAILFDKKNVTSYTQMPEKFVLFSNSGSLKNALHVNGQFYVEKSSIDDVHPSLNRRADVFYKDYEWKDGYAFSTLREIFISHKDIFSVQMKFKEYHFDELLSFPFTVPRKFKKIP